MSTATSERSTSPILSVGLLLWLAATIGSIFFIDYEPGRGARGPFAGVTLVMMGVYFLVCATVAQDFVLYRMKVQRSVDWFGPEVTHVLYGLIGAGLLVAGGWMSFTL